MPQIDLITAGIAAAERRAWFARCKAAPIPPLPVRLPRTTANADFYAAVDAGVAARLSGAPLEVPVMTRVALSQTPEAAPEGRRTCVVCGLSLKTVPGHSVCVRCAEDADKSMARLQARRDAVARDIERWRSEADAAETALTDTERTRWAKIAAVRLACTRSGRFAGTATPEQREWLGKVQKAIDNKSSTQVSDAIRRIWHATEALFWAEGGAAEEVRRADVAEVQLQAAAEALQSRQEAA